MFLTSVIALVFVGGSYATWADTLTMNGTVNTGTVNVDFSAPSAFGDTEVGFDVSHITAVLTDWNTMTVTVTNAYPCINYFFDFDVHNAGSIPVHFPAGFVYSDGWSAFITITPWNTYLPINTVVLDSTSSWYGHFILHFDNDDGFLQGTTYTFTITLTGQQYNE
ncbi:MAG: hypothetical protein MUO73_03110 [Thermoplasmata archaeon]|nr:hypothetical protein [Thermoplasmata archaeon]